MTRLSMIKGQGRATVVFYVFGLLLMMLFSACGDGSDGSLGNVAAESTETGSAVFTIKWHDAPTVKGLAKALAEETLDCINAKVEEIIFPVYDESDRLLKEGGPWPCNVHKATITGIPAGQYRKFVILGQDSAGETLQYGETPTPIEIKPGEITDLGKIDTYSFEVISSIPENDPNGNTPVDANDFSFEWNVVNNADSYHIQVSEDTNFEQLAVDQTTTDIEFKPSGLAGATQYYWRVSALDAHGNQGPYSDSWSFITKELLTWYEDSDSDSYGNSLMTMEAATQPAGYVADNTDCDDSDRFTHPGAEEICDDNIDQDCDGSDCKCEYTIRPTIGNFSAIGGDGTITVDASIENCSWTAISSENWVKIDSGSSRMGDGTLNYTVAANPETISRIATITVAGKIHEVTQDRRICVPDDYTISPDSHTFNYNGGTGTIDVVATIGCNWSASVSVDWITIISDSNGSGNGTLNYTVAANTNTSSRSAIITVAGKSHEVTQEPQPDIEPPTVKITSTIESPTSSSPIDISGKASDNVGVTQVTWSNNRGGGGVCTGTTSWSASGIALFEGNNIITVTAKDATGNTGTDALPIIYQEPSPPLIWDVSNWDESVWN